MKKILLYIIVALTVIIGGFFWLNDYIYNEKQATVTNFEECVADGNPVMESYPRQCNTKDGKHFVENIGNELEKTDLIRIDIPRPNQSLESPITIQGTARGYWYFEGDFPVVLLNSSGDVISNGFVTAQSDWMTEDFVPFKGVLEFETPFYKKGTLILKKDNASGLPERDDALEVPVIFEDAVALDVPVQSEYKEYIVYTTDASLEEEPFINDCRVRGGRFNSCGSSCEPDAEVCVAVCAYTCELK